MRRKAYSFFLCLIFLSALAQPAAFVKGRVLSSGPVSSELSPVKNAEIVLQTSDGFIYKASSDSTGAYLLRIKRAGAAAWLHIEVNKQTRCVGIKSDESLFAQKDTRQFNLQDGDTVTQNFRLDRAIVCRSLPSVEFAFRSSQIGHDALSLNGTMPQEEAINFFYNLLQDNPTIAIEISGHCDSREKSRLSKKRAKTVVSFLIKKGVDPKRLTAKGYGSKKPLIPEAIISAAETKEEKEALYQKNRRIEFKVLTFEFKG